LFDLLKKRISFNLNANKVILLTEEKRQKKKLIFAENKECGVLFGKV